MASGNNLINKYGVRRTNRISSSSHYSSSTANLKAEHCSKIPVNQSSSSTKKESVNMETICQEVDKRYKDSLEEYWNKRTNQPYKNILYDQEYNKQITKGEDLLISKTNNIQKINLNQIQEYQENVKRHNEELNNIYSLNKEQEHFKQFQYNLKHKYRITGPVTDDHAALQNNRIMYYKKEQEKLDQNRQENESLMSNVIKGGIFNADELKEFGGVSV